MRGWKAFHRENPSAVYISRARCIDSLGGYGVTTAGQNVDPPLEGELLAVAEAAGARLRAETDQDDDAARAAGDELMQAASAAMAAGRSLAEIARAEARGKDTIRHTLRADALKLVERTGTRVRDSQAEHYRAIARATRLGLPMREIAQAAGVTHGTIRAINNRLANQASGGQDEPRDVGQDQGASPEPADGVEEQAPWGEPAAEGQDRATWGE
jgi:hypothetical protein